jgi:hypothetical protein
MGKTYRNGTLLGPSRRPDLGDRCAFAFNGRDLSRTEQARCLLDGDFVVAWSTSADEGRGGLGHAPPAGQKPRPLHENATYT